MSANLNHRVPVVQRIGIWGAMTAGAVLAALGAAGNAAADTFSPAVPFSPDEPRHSLQLPWDAPPSAPDLGDTVTLNPQPLPPGPDRGIRVGLNPQPLPPGPDRGIRVGLNPQPLPPGPDRWRLPLILPGF